MVVSCFCNNTPIEKFDTFGKRTNAQCSNCKSLERHRSVILLFRNSNIIYEKMLHFAPETQLVSLFKSISKQYICGDIDPSRYKIPNIIHIDVTHIPFKNEFDCIFASHILEHILDDRKAIKEIYNALSLNGRFITIIPQRMSLKTTYEDASIITEEDRLKHFGQKDHVRWYGLDFTQRLKDAGFYIKVNYAEGCENNINNMIYDEKYQYATKTQINNYGLSQNEIIYECIKQ